MSEQEAVQFKLALIVSALWVAAVACVALALVL